MGSEVSKVLPTIAKAEYKLLKMGGSACQCPGDPGRNRWPAAAGLGL